MEPQVGRTSEGRLPSGRDGEEVLDSKSVTHDDAEGANAAAVACLRKLLDCDGMHPHALLFRMPMRSVDAVVVLQLCSAATAPVSRVAAVGPAAPASSAARRRGGTRALRSPSEGRRLERSSRASRQTRR